MFIVKSRKQIIFVVLLTVVGLSCGFMLKYVPFHDVFSVNNTGKTIVVDAGHGNPDGGAVGKSGTVESDINLQIALKLQEALQGKGYHVIMTRTDKNTISDIKGSIREIKIDDMKKRAAIIKKSKPDLFVSIHLNSFPDESVNGLRLFYAKKYEEGKRAAEIIQEEMGKATGAKTYAIKTIDRNLFLLKNPVSVSVLVECGFITNSKDEKKLKDDEYQTRIAWSIANGIDMFYE